ncbi:MAG TPA: DUF5996 family protein [Pyrinomonadaceae bacterium]|nr:DUF5996 family protein [Pyrinomonadaceae bacterium]
MKNNLWPELPLAEWQDTYATLHMWTQVVGKIRLAQTPLINHWWNVPLYVTARGLTTSPMPYHERTFQIDFDFIDHQLLVKLDDGSDANIPLVPCSVAEFYREVMRTLGSLGIKVKIWPVPVEVPDPIPFEQDNKNASYDAEYANRFWRILVRADEVFSEFRSRFIGKCSPNNFYWGSFDLAVTRFSGRRAPEREGADIITREAYSHEVISHGFWPGVRRALPKESPASDGMIHAPAFYSYTAPEPAGLGSAPVRPAPAFYSAGMKEFIMLYDDVRTANAPEQSLLEFMQSSYEAGANLAKWDRTNLERQSG